jgi:hypothetical protein
VVEREDEGKAATRRSYPGAEPGGGDQIPWRERGRGRRRIYGGAIKVFEEEEWRRSRLIPCVTSTPPGVATIVYE